MLTTHVHAIPIPAFVIMMHPERTCAPLRRKLRDLVPRLRCVQATRRADVEISNGTASLRVNSNGKARWKMLYHWPPVHHKVFAVGALEIAILASHLRAVGMGRQSGEKAFMIFEEDAEWAMLLGMPYDALTRQLSAMPRHWSVLQATVIAEAPYLRHLHRRLGGSSSSGSGGSNGVGIRHSKYRSTARGTTEGGAPIVPRSTLRGLSWPFSPGREVVENQSECLLPSAHVASRLHALLIACMVIDDVRPLPSLAYRPGLPSPLFSRLALPLASPPQPGSSPTGPPPPTSSPPAAPKSFLPATGPAGHVTRAQCWTRARA